MTDRPILFSSAMVRAIIAGQKCQTRRLTWRECRCCFGGGQVYAGPCGLCDGTGQTPTIWQKVRPGDRLWVREPVYWNAEHSNFHFTAARKGCGARAFREWRHGRNRSPIHLHRWASRITLLVTATRMERVQEIIEADAKAEGCEKPTLPHWAGQPYRSAFRGLWQSLHTKPGRRWEDNPEVVVIGFRPVLANIDRMAEAA